MKKILALALALVLALSLAACGGKDAPKPSGNNDPGDTPPASTQQEPATPGPGTDEPDDSGEEQAAASWPTADYITDAMNYTGTGTITRVSDETEWAGTKCFYVYVNESSLEDVGNYITSLKAQGFEYFNPLTHTSEDEPEPEFDFYDSFEWKGQSSEGDYLEIELKGKTEDTYWADSDWNKHPYSFNLKITLFEENWYSETGQ